MQSIGNQCKTPRTKCKRSAYPQVQVPMFPQLRRLRHVPPSFLPYPNSRCRLHFAAKPQSQQQVDPLPKHLRCFFGTKRRNETAKQCSQLDTMNKHIFASVVLSTAGHLLQTRGDLLLLLACPLGSYNRNQTLFAYTKHQPSSCQKTHFTAAKCTTLGDAHFSVISCGSRNPVHRCTISPVRGSMITMTGSVSRSI